METKGIRTTVRLLVGLIAVGGGMWGRHALLSESKPVGTGGFRAYRHFNSPPRTWADMVGRIGIALVRHGEPITGIVTELN